MHAVARCTYPKHACVVYETSLHACSEAGNTTIQTETYTDWSTRNGLIEHNVTLLVTPNAVVS